MKNKRSDNFDKFANKKKGSAVKEEYRQEKKKAKEVAAKAARGSTPGEIEYLKNLASGNSNLFQN